MFLLIILLIRHLTVQAWLQNLRICLEIEINGITGVTALSGLGCRAYVDGLLSITGITR